MCVKCVPWECFDVSFDDDDGLFSNAESLLTVLAHSIELHQVTDRLTHAFASGSSIQNATAYLTNKTKSI